jgi:hypothetical protein
VAIKLEQINAKHPQLHIECKYYKIMQGGGEYLKVPLALMGSLGRNHKRSYRKIKLEVYEKE